MGNHLAVGAPPLSPRKLRFTLSRMSSSPATATASLVTSLLDNISLHHRRLERTQSAPAPAAPGAAQQAAVSASSVAAAAVNTSRYKTELCRPYEEFGVCKYADKCQFAHGIGELRSLARHPKYKTELCRTYHTVGFCPYGPRCHFVHNEEEARQHNRAVAAALMASAKQQAAAAARGSARPAALSPSLSLDSPSPASSLSQSPTSSMSSFFSSEPELHSPQLHGDSPTASPTVLTAAAAVTVTSNTRQHHNSHSQHKQPSAFCPPSSPTFDGEFRLPVFNRLSASVFALADNSLML